MSKTITKDLHDRIDAMKPSFAHGIEIEERIDSTGDAAYYIYLQVDDATFDPEATLGDFYSFTDRVYDMLREEGIEQSAYIHVRGAE